MDQERTKNTECPCLNGFSKKEIEEKFYSNDEVSKICDKCECLTYSNGTMSCSKLS